MIQFLRALRDAITIQRSRLLQASYYRSQFVQGLGIDRILLRFWPALHYTLLGADTNKNPNAYFDTEAYRARQGEHGDQEANPLAHFLRRGATMRWPAGPRFDTGFYLDLEPQPPRDMNPLRHYLDRGRREGRPSTRLAATMRQFPVPRPFPLDEGRRWLQKGLGTSVNSESAPKPGRNAARFIRFDWDKGGWNNIRMQIEVMVCLAASFGRTLILPPPAEWYLIPSSRTHLFDFYDEDAFRAAIPTAAAGASPPEDEWRVPPQVSVLATVRIARNTLRAQDHREGWYFSRSTRMFGCLAGIFGSDADLYRQVHRTLRLRSDLLDAAWALIEEHDLTPGAVLATHIRRGDFQYPEARHLDTEAIVESLRRHGADAAAKVLIVSDAYDEELIDACRRRSWETVCWSESEAVDPKLAGVVDMLCCCTAWRFVGTPLSTFSTGIMRWRGYVSQVEGAHVDAVPRFTLEIDPSPWWAEVDPHAWLVT